MSTTADALIGVLATQIGYYEKPGGARSKFEEWYGMSGQWCAMFVSWGAEQSGNADVIPKHAYTPNGVNWFKQQGLWHPGIAGIRRGDIVYFDFPGLPNRVSHVGVVEGVAKDGSVYTIEGNTSGPSGDQRNGGCVLRKQRKSYIVGYGRPRYGSTGGAASGRNWLQKGDSGPAVLDLQNRLIRLGYSVGPAGADSEFGDGTHAGLIAFQKGNGLEPDGYYGPKSKAVLEARTNAPIDTRPRNADGSLTIAQDGIRGPGTIGRWQEVMGTPIDFTISKPKSELIKADQRFLNSVVGAQHIRNLTGKSQLVVDGDEGRNTFIVRQFWLRNAVNPIHQHNLIGHPLDFDGVWGRESNLVHQFALNHATRGSGRYGQV